MSRICRAVETVKYQDAKGMFFGGFLLHKTLLWGVLVVLVCLGVLALCEVKGYITVSHS